MHDRIVRLCYRKIIDATAQKPWDKLVWEDTYKELLMQAQLYNKDKKYRLYSDLLHHVQSAEKLPFLVSTAVVGYLKQLNETMPDVTNVLGKIFLPFANYKFEIIESDIANQAVHKVAVSFISKPIAWHDTINGALLISLNGNKDANDNALLTEMVTLQSFLSIFSLKKEAQ